MARVGDLLELLKGVYGPHGFQTGVAALIEVSDPEIVFYPAGIWLDSEPVCHGHDEVTAFFDDLREALEELDFEPVRVEERGDRIALEVLMEMRGRHTGLTETRRLSHLWSFRDGKAVELRAFAEPGGAFEAL
ncbi:MAG: SnoaL-like domain [Thermoleophilaceae bacterium]|nr:SnoaL-like domain [Thermoleophilaceae bacterium]